jgi:hypothetical protein
MMKQTLALLAALALAAPVSAAGIALTSPADTALAVAISDAVDATTERVGKCIGEGGAHQDCLCAGAAEIAGVRDALDAALAVHPEWEGQTLSVADKGDGQSLTLFLDTVAASSVPPDCG